MRLSRTRPVPLVLGLVFVLAVAWQAWAFVGDSIQHAGPASGGGGAFGGDLFAITTIGDPVSASAAGSGFELRSGRWLGGLTPTPTAVDEPALRPTVHRLIGAFPNPFNPRTEVRFELAEATRVLVQVHDIRGRLVRTLINESRPSGPHAVVWNGKDNRGTTVASGTYFLRFNAGDRVETRKVALLK